MTTEAPPLALRIEAALKLLYPDEITPTAKDVLEKILADEA